MSQSFGELGPAGPVIIHALDFDTSNLAHLALKNIDEERVLRLVQDSPVMVGNRPGRAAGHLLIAQDFDSRMWTIAMLLVDPEFHVWRPITGWPSVRKEIAAWENAN